MPYEILNKKNNGNWSINEHLYHTWLAETSSEKYIRTKTKYPDFIKEMSPVVHLSSLCLRLLLNLGIKVKAPLTTTTFPEKIDLIKLTLVNTIKKIKKSGKSIHGYGASTKGNVLLQYFGIGKKMLDFVAERNPKKYGFHTPGTNIKIVSEKQSRKLKPSYYLVLPWHFKREIIKREKQTINSGSSFIFPLPKLSIISKI